MKISVVTVCYNSESTIVDCVKSVASQTWSDVEHIVIDGGSTDGTLSVVAEYSHSNTIVISEPDEGMYDAMNKGLELSSGEYVAFLNSDDLYAGVHVLELVAKCAKRNPSDCLLGDVLFFKNNPSNLTGRKYSCRGFAAWWLKIGVMPPHPGLFVRREVLLKANGFDLGYKIAADFDLAARLFLSHKATWGVLDETVALFRSGGISTQRGSGRIITSEAAESLSKLSVPFSRLLVLLKYPFKLHQFLPVISFPGR